MSGAVVLARGPRRLARVLSWMALVMAILDGLWFGLLVRRDGPDWAARLYADGAGLVGPAPSAARSPSLPAAEKLGRRVCWRPGARDATARWAREGFAPTVAEVRRLHPGSCGSLDADAHVPTG